MQLKGDFQHFYSSDAYVPCFSFSAVKPGSLLIDTSTIEPAVAKEVGELVQSKGAVFLDAPVSGGPKSLFLLTNATLLLIGNYMACHSGQGHLPQNLLVINYLLNLLLPWTTPVKEGSY